MHLCSFSSLWFSDLQTIDYVALIMAVIIIVSAFIFSISSKIYHPPSQGIQIFAVSIVNNIVLQCCRALLGGVPAERIEKDQKVF